MYSTRSFYGDCFAFEDCVGIQHLLDFTVNFKCAVQMPLFTFVTVLVWICSAVCVCKLARVCSVNNLNGMCVDMHERKMRKVRWWIWTGMSCYRSLFALYGSLFSVGFMWVFILDEMFSQTLSTWNFFVCGAKRTSKYQHRYSE